MSTLEHAISVAARAHTGQLDTAGSPYILHPLRVLLRLGNTEERIVAALHDVIEDSPLTAEDLRREGFSDRIVEAVLALTRPPGESYEDYLQRLQPNPLARRVKLADLADNMECRRRRQPLADDVVRLARYEQAWLTLTGNRPPEGVPILLPP